MIVVWVGLAGAIGAPSRFLLDSWIQRRVETTTPVGTMVVNLSGALLLGVLMGLLRANDVPLAVEQVLGAGFCGAFTTFSTFSFESIRLAEEGAWRPLATYLGVTLVGGLLAAAAGLTLAGFV